MAHRSRSWWPTLTVLLFARAQAKQEAGKLVVKEKQMDGSEKEKTTTVGQYDADEIIKQAKQMCMTVRRCALGARRRRDRAVA